MHNHGKLHVKVKRGIGIFTIFRRVEIFVNDEIAETMPLFSSRDVQIPHPGSRLEAKYFSSKSKQILVNPGDVITVRESLSYMMITALLFVMLILELLTDVDIPFSIAIIIALAILLIVNKFMGYDYALDVKRNKEANEKYYVK